VEGLTIYYAADGKGYLLASSQGDSTYAVFTRAGNNDYLGNFAIGASGGVDSVEESDGADVINVPLGTQFPSGLLVVQDGSNDPAVVVNDDGEIANVSSNFKFVPWQNVANAFPNPLEIDTTSFNPRDPLFNTVNGTDDADNLTGSFRSDRINGFKGDDTITGLLSNDRLTGGGDNDTFVINRGDGIDTITDFGGIGTGSRPTPDAIAEADTIKFQGEGLIAKNMLLTQTESDLVISFENVNDTQVILNNFNLENLDNLNSKGNILFNEQNQIQDSFDVFNADWQRQQIFNRDSVTFLNDLDNTTKGFNDSQDVINGQSGNDKLRGLSGNDLLRGDTGNDTLLGGKGSDRIWGRNDDDLLNGGIGNDTLQGGVGQDQLIGGKGSDLFVLSASQGVDIISDFKISQADRIGLAGGLTFEQLVIAQGIDSNANNTLISVFGENLAIITDLQASSLDSQFLIV
jgi:Ca2+-binding RTX toxin-like protein